MKSCHGVFVKDDPGLYQGIGFSLAVQVSKDHRASAPAHGSTLRNAGPKGTLQSIAHLIAQLASGKQRHAGAKARVFTWLVRHGLKPMP
jgi:hypothetical protein